ncbi:MAG: YidC/Oxa1 family membrane protein insertase [Erysipelotrichaceae bacterium]
MKRFFKDKKKLLILSVFMILGLAACTNARGTDGQIIKDLVIYLDTPFSQTFNTGSWFDGIIVWPIAQMINFVAEFSDAGIAVIVVTFLIQLITAAFSIKSQVASQKMQMLQPEMNRIQAKYAGKTDDRSKMQQATEMQALYSKHKISPFGSILVMFIQFPIIIGMYQAVMRAYSVIAGDFMGVNLSITPIDGIRNAEWAYLVIFLLMVGSQFASMKFPQWLQEKRKKRLHVKEKKYAQPEAQGSGMMKSMNMMTYVSLAMISFLSLTWPLGMSFYWLVSAVCRVLQSWVIDRFFIKD